MEDAQVEVIVNGENWEAHIVIFEFIFYLFQRV